MFAHPGAETILYCQGGDVVARDWLGVGDMVSFPSWVRSFVLRFGGDQ